MSCSAPVVTIRGCHATCEGRIWLGEFRRDTMAALEAIHHETRSGAGEAQGTACLGHAALIGAPPAQASGESDKARIQRIAGSQPTWLAPGTCLSIGVGEGSVVNIGFTRGGGGVQYQVTSTSRAGHEVQVGYG
mgnify:CR=1 FL=1